MKDASVKPSGDSAGARSGTFPQPQNPRPGRPRKARAGHVVPGMGYQKFNVEVSLLEVAAAIGYRALKTKTRKTRLYGTAIVVTHCGPAGGVS